MFVLEDVIGPNLKVIFCGTAAGSKSAQRRAYYAGPGNKFWKMIHEIKRTDRILKPEEYVLLQSFGVGLTDIAKLVSGADSTLRVKHFDSERLRNEMVRHQPFALAFNGKKAAQIFLRERCNYGRQLHSIGKTRVYVLPSTSGAANRYWDKQPWCELGRDLKDT